MFHLKMPIQVDEGRLWRDADGALDPKPSALKYDQSLPPTTIRVHKLLVLESSLARFFADDSYPYCLRRVP